MNNLFKGKRFLVIAGVLVLLLLVLMAFSMKPKSSVEQAVQPTQFIEPTIPPEGVFDETNAEKSPQVLQAIQEQMQADQEYSTWQQNNETNYPWLRKLPLTSEKYFVYFDLDKKTFIGRLYVKSEDDVEKLKSDILQILKVDEEIPVENFQVQWQVNP